MDLLIALAYIVCGVACVAAFLIAIGFLVEVDLKNIKTKKTGYAVLAVVMLTCVGVGGGYALYHRNDSHDAAAVTILEDRYDITVNVIGDYRTKEVTEWTINGREHDCYVTVAGFNHIDTADLLCKDYTAGQEWVKASAL